ncbi:MAG TPA: PaaX family transcriptional regulator C-terminal domain-containing protein [Opitutaceae bacterium]
MGTPAGPSLQLMLGVSETVGEVSIMATRAVWDRWFSSQRFYRKLAQFETQGWIERGPASGKGLDRVVRLTEAGREAALGGADPQACWGRKWDGRWRLVLFDIPESQRALRLRLCRALRELRFGYLQNSVWVSPDPPLEIGRMLRGLDLNVEILTIMDARPCGGESDADLVAGAWDFARVNRDYEVYLEVLESRPVRQSGRSWNTWLAVEWKAWRRALAGDPLLPAALLPDRYRGKEAFGRRMKMLRKVFGVNPG